MILKGGVRADALALGKYLLESKNERVEIGALDGFNSSDLLGCMAEVDAIAAGVKSRQYLFSLSLNPPAHEAVGNDVYEDAVTRIKAKFGLEHQPHALVYHENAGRRHGHLVISRIDPETMTVKRLGKWKEKLQQVSKELFLDNGMTPPKGLIDRRERDINAFSYAD